MRCTIRLKLMPWAGAALSDATVAVARVLASVFDGLWHSTQYSVLLRRPPCSESATWQLLQLLERTTVRRGATAEPSTEKLTTGFMAPTRRSAERLCRPAPFTRRARLATDGVRPGGSRPEWHG